MMFPVSVLGVSYVRKARENGNCAMKTYGFSSFALHHAWLDKNKLEFFQQLPCSVPPKYECPFVGIFPKSHKQPYTSCGPMSLFQTG